MIAPVQLDKTSSEPLYFQLYKSLKEMVEKGQLKNNEKLPPIRKISEILRINNSTVINAYKLLENNGYAYSRVGSGTYVYSKKASNSCSTVSIFSGTGDMEGKNLRDESIIDFSNSAPDPGLFPIQDFKALFNKVLDRDGGYAFSYSEAKGYGPLRECIADYMRRNMVYSNPGDIYIISGAQQGIDIITKALIDFGDVIFTEKPTYTGAIAVFKSRGAKIVDIPVNKYGIDVVELEEKLKGSKPKFIYVMPNFQNPTGFSYSREVMEKLLFLAEKYDFYIIEDDYLSELYYSDKKPVTLKSMDDNNRVIFIKSFSKTFMPGARLGFLIVPGKMQDTVLSAKYFSDISSSGLMQRVFDLFLRSNLLDSFIEQIKHEYMKRYSVITKCLDDKVGVIDYYKPAGGIHLWLRLPEGISSNMIYSECLVNRLKVSPGSAFYLDSLDSRYIKLNYSSLSIDEISKGIDILGSIINRTSV